MSKIRLTSVLVLALAVAALVATAAFAKTAPFSASYSGKVSEKVAGQLITASTAGKGKGSIVGKSTIAGVVKATTADPPCSPFSGPGSIKSAKGTLKLSVLPTSRGCAAGEDDQDNIALSGSAKVLRGTGMFKKAKGTLRFTGHYDRGSGAFTVKLKGTLTY